MVVDVQGSSDGLRERTEKDTAVAAAGPNLNTVKETCWPLKKVTHLRLTLLHLQELVAADDMEDVWTGVGSWLGIRRSHTQGRPLTQESSQGSESCSSPWSQLSLLRLKTPMMTSRLIVTKRDRLPAKVSLIDMFVFRRDPFLTQMFFRDTAYRTNAMNMYQAYRTNAGDQIVPGKFGYVCRTIL
jgi:hypothetical protein